MTLRSFADLLEETARSRRASSRASAVVGRTLKHFGVAKALTMVADVVRVEDQEADQ